MAELEAFMGSLWVWLPRLVLLVSLLSMAELINTQLET